MIVILPEEKNDLPIYNYTIFWLDYLGGHVGFLILPEILNQVPFLF